MKKAFAVVGHSNWGKSYSLKKLIGSAYKHWINIEGRWYYVKHMSNDDISGELYEWVRKFIEKYQNDDYGLIFALCPDFENLEKKTERILELLFDLKIPLFFFVLRKKYHSDKMVRDNEITKLKNFGLVKLVNGSSEDIGKELLSFIKQN